MLLFRGLLPDHPQEARLEKKQGERRCANKNLQFPGGGGWWGTFGSMRRGRFFHHKIHIKHQDLARKDGRYNMVRLITREMDE